MTSIESQTLPGFAQKDPGVAQSPGIRILIVDDHPAFRKCLIQLLRVIDNLKVVGSAADGREALDRVVQLHPDVVLMDVDMPRMSGIEATRKITTLLPKVRVIGLSMHPVHEFAAQQMRAAGAIDHFPKDGPVEELLAAIQSNFPLANH